MGEFTEKALTKLKNEYSAGEYDKYAAVMKASVKKTLEDFCRQDEEFAQAVAQGGSFEACMKAVAKNCGSGLSDLEAYRRAVQFYFPGAEVRMQMSIALAGAAGTAGERPLSGAARQLSPTRGEPRETRGETSGDGGDAAEKAGIVLDFTDFL